jgi:uncharacterized protein YdhG (YjbR/CyaY superfamily)
MKNQHHDQAKTINDYVSGFPEDIRRKLEEIRSAIHQAAPEAAETISYSMPAFKLNGVLVYFAAFKDHIGFFPTASGVSHFQKELKPYDTSKGTVRLPLDKPLPLGLIKKIVEFRVAENREKSRQ